MENKYNLPENHLFTRNQIIDIFSVCFGKTLGELDKNHVFDRAIKNPKITGIAGDVVEQSILGYEPDSDQRPDILVDGIPYEVKTTGVRKNKKTGDIEAKEPMSITAVSPLKIINEDFYSSHFWEKIEHMLLVYYLYESYKTVKAIDYASFPFKGYELHEFSSSDVNILKTDWEIVRDFIRTLKTENEYSRLSSELRNQLMYIDTAPKWPNPPRFRLKRSVVTSIVKAYFDERLEVLPEEYDSFADLDNKLHSLTDLYRGMSVTDLLNDLSIPYSNLDKLSKSISEQIVIKMFGGKSKKINKIDLFSKVGIIAKTICVTSKGGRTEDMKLMQIDFDELINECTFEETSIYDYFSNHQLLCIIFEEKDSNQEFKDNKFLGFKRIAFDSSFIDTKVKKSWDIIADLVKNKKLVERPCYKKDGSIIYNKVGTVKTEINFPKSATYDVFVRGSGEDSRDKSVEINGIKMYHQWVWIKGSTIVDMLKNKPFI